jgi:hypothetical protein
VRYIRSWSVIFIFYSIFAALGLIGICFSTFVPTELEPVSQNSDVIPALELAPSKPPLRINLHKNDENAKENL